MVPKIGQISPTEQGRRPMTIVIASPVLVLKSRESFCQSLVPVGDAGETASKLSAASRTMITGVLAVFSFSVRT